MPLQRLDYDPKTGRHALGGVNDETRSAEMVGDDTVPLHELCSQVAGIVDFRHRADLVLVKATRWMTLPSTFSPMRSLQPSTTYSMILRVTPPPRTNGTVKSRRILRRLEQLERLPSVLRMLDAFFSKAGAE